MTSKKVYTTDSVLKVEFILVEAKYKLYTVLTYYSTGEVKTKTSFSNNKFCDISLIFSKNGKLIKQVFSRKIFNLKMSKYIK